MAFCVALRGQGGLYLCVHIMAVGGGECVAGIFSWTSRAVLFLQLFKEFSCRLLLLLIFLNRELLLLLFLELRLESRLF